ncbi:surface antigen [Pomona bat hepatitis B virus]|uniref:Large envelope protein n=1 Tax=Pomona bat hepatitis B virus TaxID=2049933 RepID=A0A0A7DPC2_9HEPA|nr:surface antigen [Pomona bat hepatitis B virus]AIW47288.1 surface antigen [Pomona bat hepatitis B virus]
MGNNRSVPNPFGFLPDHQLQIAPNSEVWGKSWDQNQQKDPWPQALEPSLGAWGPSLVPPHGGLLGTGENSQGVLINIKNTGETTKTIIGRKPQTIITKTSKTNPSTGITPTKQTSPPTPASNRQKGRQPTPPTLPAKQTHPHLNMNKTWRQRYASLITPVPGSSSTILRPAEDTASDSVFYYSPIGDPAIDMGITSSELLAPLVGFQVVFFLWTKILTIGQSLDSWWTSLSFLGGTPECNGLNLLSPTCKHSPTSCPATCPGFRWMCLRRFIIYLLVLLLCLICLLALLDWRGLLPVCPLNPLTTTTKRCNTCTVSADDATSWASCCCSKPAGGNRPCWAIPSSRALGKFLRGLASRRFSWLHSLVPWLQWFVELSPTAWLLLIWMMWYWGRRLLHTLSPFMPLFVLFSLIWGSF